MNKKKFLETFEDMNRAKGVDQETLLDALKESFRLTFAKKIEDEYKVDKKPVRVNQPVNKEKTIVKLPDALVRVDIDVKKAKIDCFRQWLVVNDDDVNDDYIEIGLTEAQEKNPKLALGDYYEEELSLDTLKDKDISRFKSCFTQKINKAEKDALLATFANKIGTIVTGTVEKCDAHSVIVELGRTTATLFQKDLIGDEKFNQGDSIKVYVEGIGKDDKKGSLVKISRSCNGYLRCLFENEIHEIYDGTVVIKYVERMPGRRAKVCVYSNDPNVDPSGACIGQNGTRIQNIVSQLGNAKDSKEKIPTFEETLKFVDGRVPLLIEIKNQGKVGELEKKVIDLLKDYKGQYAVQSFNPYVLEYFYKHAPNILRGQLAGFFRGEKLSFIKKYALKRMMLNKKISKPDFISYEAKRVPNRFVRKFKSLPLLVWTVTSQSEYLKVVKYCDNVIFENFEPKI